MLFFTPGKTSDGTIYEFVNKVNQVMKLHDTNFGKVTDSFSLTIY